MSELPDQNNPSASSPFLTRQARLAEILSASGLHALALNPGPTLSYLTGLNFHLMERPVVAFFSPDQPVVLVLPELEQGKTERLPFPVLTVPYPEDPTAWPGAFRRAIQLAELNAGRIGIEPGRLRVLELRFLETAAPDAGFLSAEESLAALRMSKDADEVSSMRRAVQIAQDALTAVLPMIRVGMTERELAGELTLQLLRNGSDSELPFPPIVSGGPNSANPHAAPSDRSLAPGDLLVIDWGAAFAGYFSDLTRTFAVGRVEPEPERIAQVVLEANAAGRAAAGPGVPAGEVDRAARAVIAAAGYGPSFIHRTGHGLGLEAHEPPYIRGDSRLPLAPGMTFTVEPGIYLTGRNGVRIEDNLVITETGSETLSSLPRELVRIGE